MARRAVQCTNGFRGSTRVAQAKLLGGLGRGIVLLVEKFDLQHGDAAKARRRRGSLRECAGAGEEESGSRSQHDAAPHVHWLSSGATHAFAKYENDGAAAAVYGLFAWRGESSFTRSAVALSSHCVRAPVMDVARRAAFLPSQPMAVLPLFG